MAYSISSDFFFTNGVLDRIRKMLSSYVIPDIKSQSMDLDSVKDENYPTEMKRIFSELCVALAVNTYKIPHNLPERLCRSHLQRIRTIAYHVEDILDAAENRVLYVNIPFYLHLIPELKKLLHILGFKEDASIAEKSGSESESADSRLAYFNSDHKWFYSVEDIVGRESERQQIIDWILSSSNQGNPNVISVSGVGGIGKTTLARLVYKDAQVSAGFEVLSWAFTSSLDFRSTIFEIVRAFTHQSWYYLRSMEMSQLVYKLGRILRGKKYLLVVDDIGLEQLAWWKELLKILKMGSTGSTVLVITQWETVDREIRSTKHFEVKGLQEDDSWSLFTSCAGFDEEAQQEYPSLKCIGISIVNKCHGCPVAIKTLGSMLADNRDESLWNQANDESNLWTTFAPAYDAHGIGFRNMSSDLAQCFVGSAILPENRLKSRKQLVYFWMALGLLQSSTTNGDPRDIGDRYCDQLLSRAFLHLHQSDDGRERLQLNHTARQLAVDMMQQDVVSLPGPSLVQQGRHLLWEEDSISAKKGFDPYSLNLSKVRTFFFFKKHVGYISKFRLEKLISKLNFVRVLFLDGAIFEELPESIGKLKLLRYLSLAGNISLKLLPESLCSLVSLQTMDLSGCEELQTLPENMNNLARLRHLFLSTKLTLVPRDFLLSLTTLNHLKICNCPNLISLPWSISSSRSIDYLRNLKELSIVNCKHLDLTELSASYFPKGLQSLQFQGLPELREFPNGFTSAASSLRHLIVRSCENLTALPECLRMCIHLSELVIDNCHNISILPRGIKEIQTLQILKILNCPKLVASYQSGVGEDWNLISHIPRIQLQHQVIRNSATSTLKEHPGSEGALSTEQDVVKEVDFPHQSLNSYVLQEDVDLAQKSNVMEELKYYCSMLSLLPENYEIEKESLFQLWMADRQYMELQVEEECFSFILNNGYLVQSGSNFMTGKSTYQINIRKINELLESQEDKESSYLKWDSENQPNKWPDTESIRHLSLVCTDIDETIFQTLQKFSKLRTLLFLANYGHRVKHIPDQLFLCLGNLQALDLSRTQIKELPGSIDGMIYLRYLDLSWTLIEWLPDTICSLVELQTLKLRGCVSLCELPRELNRLTNLRHLDFDVLRQLEIMPRGIGDLVNLQTLTAFLVGTEDGSKIQELKGMDRLAGNLCIAKLENVEDAIEARDVALYKKEQLERLELRWTSSEFSGTHNNSYTVLEYLQPWTKLEELRILCYEGEIFPSWISNPEFNKLARILFYCCENLLELPLIEQLPCLKHLGLTKMNSVTKIERWGKMEKDVAFPKLETMEINEMQRLRVWDWKKSNEGDFTSLTQLIINDCPELEEFDVLRHLSSIKKFEIRECPNLQSLSDMKLPDSFEELVVEDCIEIQKKCLDEEGEDWYKD